ncbi:HAD-IC family P-type ATPase [Spirosoma sp. HMF4905]|uniref:HAD-IC family P-type ATPase n=1 Tax=Spirosoma arboris TaxID=2682092 RepID=A0A7K1SK11_9BACT|nr:cation-transporting P-type ATPase [Spirosoma arboris]MVM33926.1 HAD-IC family P-type ATPase [Spirosoma arboris]
MLNATLSQQFPNIDLKRGLTTAEAAQRLAEHGPNRLETQKTESWLTVLLRQFRSLIVWVLAVAAGLSFALGDVAEGWAILAVLVINTLTGFILEWHAGRSMQALRQLDIAPVRVIRDGQVQEIRSDLITMGDLLLVEAGDVIVADAELLDVHQLELDESTLTGESSPVAKTTTSAPADAPLSDQTNRLFKGTAVTAGTGRAVVTAIGGQTELGKIAQLVGKARQTATPLEAKLDALSKVLIGVTLGLTALFVLVGLLRQEALLPLLETSVALAIAAIPEGLSVVATMALAYGMLRLARKKVLVKRLSAVETLGGTNVIFTDKTGTLTENRIDVFSLQLLGDQTDLYAEIDKNTEKTPRQSTDNSIYQTDAFEQLILLGVLCNNAEVTIQDEESRELGDPVEVALLKFAHQTGYQTDLIRNQNPRLAEQAFSSDTRMMATLHRSENGYLVVVKGALEEVLDRCVALTIEQRKRQHQRAETMAQAGLRTLAFAYYETTDQPDLDTFAQQELLFVGLIGFLDPPRLSVTDALIACRKAGIRVIMATGDHPATALTIARQVALIEPDDSLVMTGKDLGAFDQFTPDEQTRLLTCRVFARVSPAQKLALIDFYQRQGNVVGMTGDGVNDAPALKKADIGIAMGLRGTPVAAEAADLVLKDDSFASIVRAIGQGRVIFENIRKFVIFLLSCNLSEIFVMALAELAGLSSPLLPLQILFVNIVTDVFPALALGIGRENRVLMQRPPRSPNHPLLSRSDWGRVVRYALLMTLAVLGTYVYSRWQWGYTEAQSRTLTFYMVSWVQLLHVFNMYSGKQASFFVNEITRNRYVWLALLLCIGILLFTYYVPLIHDVLAIQPLDPKALLLIVGAGFLPLLMVRLIRIWSS